MNSRHRQIAERLRDPIPPPRSRAKPVGSWRGLKVGTKLLKLSDESKVWEVVGVTRAGAEVHTADGSFGLLTDPEWQKNWKRAGQKGQKRTTNPKKEK